MGRNSAGLKKIEGELIWPQLAVDFGKNPPGFYWTPPSVILNRSPQRATVRFTEMGFDSD